MKTWHILLLATLLLKSCILITPKVQAAEAKPPQAVIKIGVICPLTGSLAVLGEEIRDALTLAREDAKNDKYDFQLIIEDDQLVATKTAAALQKLINVDHVDALITFSSGTGNVVAPVAERMKIPHMCICSDSHVAKGKFNFIHWTPPAIEARRYVQEVTKKGIKSIAIFELNQQGAIAVTEEVKKELAAHSIKITSVNRFNGGERDFRVTISKIKTEKPDALLLMAFSPEVELIQKQLKENGVTASSTGIESFDLTENPAVFEGCWYISGAAAPKQLRDRMAARFHTKRFFLSAFAYDAFSLLAQAYDREAKPDHEAAAADLAQMKGFHSILGPITADAEGIIQSPASTMIIKNGLPTPLE